VTSLQDRIVQASQQDVRYMEIMHRLKHNTGTGTRGSTGT